MSPEQFKNALTYKIDVWAFGCVLLQLYTNKVPYSGIPTDASVCIEIQKTDPLEWYQKSDNAEPIDSQLHYILYSCFQRNHENRPSAYELLNHQFFKKKKKLNSYQNQ